MLGRSADDADTDARRVGSGHQRNKVADGCPRFFLPRPQRPDSPATYAAPWRGSCQVRLSYPSTCGRFPCSPLPESAEHRDASASGTARRGGDLPRVPRAGPVRDGISASLSPLRVARFRAFGARLLSLSWARYRSGPVRVEEIGYPGVRPVRLKPSREEAQARICPR